jgi:hypothetical protein
MNRALGERQRFEDNIKKRFHTKVLDCVVWFGSFCIGSNGGEMECRVQKETRNNFLNG